MAAQWIPPATSSPSTVIEISVACQKLADMDITSKSDPVCVMFMKSKDNWIEIGRTERLKNNLNPVWVQKFVVDYHFEERQLIKFEVYDWDSKSEKLNSHDFLASLETSLGVIVSAPAKKFVQVIKDGPSKGGRFIITAEELAAAKDILHVQFAAKDLDKKDFFGKSDPYFIISRMSASGQFTPVYKSETIQKNLNPTWKKFSKLVSKVCNGDYNRKLKFDVYDWDKDSDDDLIGSFTTTLKELTSANGKSFECINPKKQSKKKYKNSGTFRVVSFLIEPVCTFLDFIQGGTSINFSVAIDFTASNGHPNEPSSLHYRNHNHDNSYAKAIRAVGEIIQDYDSDKQFPALGFGAKIPPHGKPSHEFFLNLQASTPFCAGVEGILQAYHSCIQQVSLYGPTNFSPVINHVARFAREYQDGRQYFVLLIITDGLITDMDDTIRAIVQASSLPMSIIIVGVGDEDFESMEKLDADVGPLMIDGNRAQRDIVQFVAMRNFSRSQDIMTRSLLAKEVLAELPQQLVTWMNSRGLKPMNIAQ